ncbi:terminase large subunit [Rhizobium phage vB_RglS_P106B]|uniref:Terminase large subunit n=1 Tax=Rhizobium phage vB_RglS_P106B TaxID=1458697 RepID=W6E8I4_9CAUD|nr:terminase large subunit [Rhizobium phage vB_RglS_P106B]AHJ10684.1 terminase large subunit [Rhizobium phage vB_RglS_P106B]
MNGDLFDWRLRATGDDFVKPWKPFALSHDEWPPNYKGVYAWRIKTLAELRKSPDLLASAKAYYSTRPAEFIMHWMDTYDPRKSDNKWIPFVFFAKQAEFITFLHCLRTDQESGLIEKARDMGATWGSCGYSVWSWLFVKDDAIGWGSRKQELVDKLGDPDSIFEKLRLIINRLPDIWRPKGLKPRDHLTFMKCINPENGATITGESGDNIGRGGRKSMYFKDESAHYERPEKIEAALGDNTRVQVDISSVNGLNNPFYRRREAGQIWTPSNDNDPGYTRIFIIDWRDHPEKTQQWYDERKAKHEREGLLHIFAQEVDRNYSAAISNTIIPYEYIVAAVDAHLKLPVLMRRPDDIPDTWMAGLDVADGGIDRNALAKRQWVILRHVEEWGERDPGVSTRRAIIGTRGHKQIKVMYDAIGVGAGVKTEYNRITIDEKITAPKFVAWNAGAGVLQPYERLIPDDPESLKNKDFFGNLKAQAWWSLYGRFYKTWKCVQALEKGLPLPNYSADELISLDSAMPLLQQLMKELAQAVRVSNTNLKTIVDKTPEGTKSPNLADAVVMAFFPLPDDFATVMVGTYG